MKSRRQRQRSNRKSRRGRMSRGGDGAYSFKNASDAQIIVLAKAGMLGPSNELDTWLNSEGGLSKQFDYNGESYSLQRLDRGVNVPGCGSSRTTRLEFMKGNQSFGNIDLDC